MPDYPTLLKLSDAVALLQSHGIRGGRRNVLRLTASGIITSVVLPGGKQRYYHRDAITEFIRARNIPSGK